MSFAKRLFQRSKFGGEFVPKRHVAFLLCHRKVRSDARHLLCHANALILWDDLLRLRGKRCSLHRGKVEVLDGNALSGMFEQHLDVLHPVTMATAGRLPIKSNGPVVPFATKHVDMLGVGQFLRVLRLYRTIIRRNALFHCLTIHCFDGSANTVGDATTPVRQRILMPPEHSGRIHHDQQARGVERCLRRPTKSNLGIAGTKPTVSLKT